jgi:hypothetical protein
MILRVRRITPGLRTHCVESPHRLKARPRAITPTRRLEALPMMSWIRCLVDSALLVMALVAGGLVLYLAVPRARMRPVPHPVACHACSANAPAEVLDARNAHLARIGAIEIETDE